jgi:hypothetical protein
MTWLLLAEDNDDLRNLLAVSAVLQKPIFVAVDRVCDAPT